MAKVGTLHPPTLSPSSSHNLGGGLGMPESYTFSLSDAAFTSIFVDINTIYASKAIWNWNARNTM